MIGLFTTKAGRLVLGIMFMIVVTSLSGISNLPVPVASKHKVDPAPATCAVAATTVSATGLPTAQLINFMVTSSGGTTGWVLGYTDTGSWSVTVPARTGPTTYEFVSQTSGPNGAKYTVFASCSAS